MRHVAYAAFAVLTASALGFGCSATDDGGTSAAATSGSGGSTSTTTSTTGTSSTTGTGGGGGGGGSDCTDEVCDGVDNDCDQEVDEGCDCIPGDTQSCYSGPRGTAGKGECKNGLQTCDSTGQWGGCAGEVVPEDAEICDGKDEDCSGVEDDNIADIVCGIGACVAAAPGCVEGAPGTCVPGQPGQEACDGIDNDCDQLTDESDPLDGAVCDSGIPGLCAAGKYQCLIGNLTCVADNMAVGESCDGVDNDCNGAIDNDVPGTGGLCSTGVPGECANGAIQCQSGVVDCFPITPASAEVCDNLDNDCDGAVDQGDPGGGSACSTGQPGVCGGGTLHCANGMVSCMPNTAASAEVCDKIDNNCNGQIDEGSPGAGLACSCGPLATTVCVAGSLYCQNCTIEVTCNDGVDEDFNNGTDCADPDCAFGCALTTPCGPGEKLYVYTSTNVPKSIVDLQTITSTINVTEVGTIAKVGLFVNLTHTWVSDVDISLTGPSGATIVVSQDAGGSFDNYTNTQFEDTCPTIVGQSAPFTGCFAPETPFSTFNGTSPAGTWTLSVADDTSTDQGTLNAYKLALCVGP